MNTYNIPRNVKGEGRILFIFSAKALIYTAVGAGIGLVFYFILNLIGMAFIGYIIIACFGLIGGAIGTFKMPNSTSFALTRDTGRRKYR